MEKEKSMTKGLKKLLIASIIFGVLTLGVFFAFPFLAKSTGKQEYASFNAFSQYLLTNLTNLFVFKYGNPDNFVYFGVSIGLYVMLLCWLIAVLAGVFVCDNRKTALLVISFPLGLVNCLLYAFIASSSQDYYQVIIGHGPYRDKLVLLIIVICLLVFYAVFFIMNIIFYFWAMARSFAYEKEPKKEEEPKEEESKEESKEEVQPQEEVNNDEPQEKKYKPIRIVIVNKRRVIEKAPEPVQEEVQPEPVPEPEPEPIPEPIPEPVMVMEEPKEEEIIDIPLREEEPEEEVMPLEDQPEDSDNNEWNRNKRQPFINRIVEADLDIKANYNEIKNEILSYGVKARLSRSGETFRLKDKKYAKIYLVGKTLKVYLALSPEDYKDSTIPVEDVGHRPNYAEMPLLFKVRSGLSVRRCKELIKAAMEKDGLKQNEIGDTKWVDELRKLNAEKAKENKNK